MSDLCANSIPELLALHVKIMEELGERNVLSTGNDLTGGLAEYLFCKAFGWNREKNSNKGFDATDTDGTRYQIKGRRARGEKIRRQMSGFSDLDRFDFLAGILFYEDYSIRRAGLIPVDVVRHNRRGSKFFLRDKVWRIDGVVDVTACLCEVFSMSPIHQDAVFCSR